MCGNDRVRYCGHCKKHVFNLSGMTRPEAEDFLLRQEGGLCVRFYRRPDGSVMTQDCQSFAATRRWVTAGLGLAGVLLAGLIAMLATAGPPRGRIAPLWAHEIEPFRTILQWLEPTPTVMGECPPTPIPVPPVGGVAPPAPMDPGVEPLPN
jgi:hypothetical protein